MDLYSEFSNEINLHDVDSKLTLDILAVISPTPLSHLFESIQLSK